MSPPSFLARHASMKVARSMLRTPRANAHRGQVVGHRLTHGGEGRKRGQVAGVEAAGIAGLGEEALGLRRIVGIGIEAEREVHDARDDRSRQARVAQALRLVDAPACRWPGWRPAGRGDPCQGDLGFHCSGNSSHQVARRDDLGKAQLGIRLDRRRLDADHQVADVRLPGLEHGQARRAVGDALDDHALDRRLLPPVLLVRLEHELHARVACARTDRVRAPRAGA